MKARTKAAKAGTAKTVGTMTLDIGATSGTMKKVDATAVTKSRMGIFPHPANAGIGMRTYLRVISLRHIGVKAHEQNARCTRSADHDERRVVVADLCSKSVRVA